MNESELIQALNGRSLSQVTPKVRAALSTLIRPGRGQSFTSEQRRKLGIFWLRIDDKEGYEQALDQAIAVNPKTAKIKIKEDIYGNLYTPPKTLTNCREGEPYEAFEGVLNNAIFVLASEIEWPQEEAID